jgi:hypothetical protein
VYDREIIAKEVAYLSTHPEVGAVFTGAYRINANSEIIGSMYLPNKLFIATCDFAFEFKQIFPLILRDYNFFVCPSAMVRTDILKKDVGNWNGESYRTSADLDVWLKILKKYKVGIIPEPLVRYRVSDSHGTAREYYMKKNRADFFSVLDYYINNEIIGYNLTYRDKSNISFLIFRYNIQRATNMLVDYEFHDAMNLMSANNYIKLFLNYILNYNIILFNRNRITHLLIGIMLHLISFSRFKPLADLISRKKYGFRKTPATRS